MGGKEGFRMAKGQKECYLRGSREERTQTKTYCWKCLVPSKLSSCLLCGIKGWRLCGCESLEWARGCGQAGEATRLAGMLSWSESFP